MERRPRRPALKQLQPSDWAWLTIAVGVPIYNILIAKDGDTLSERVDHYLARRPWLTRTIIHMVARHLTNELRPDPLHTAFVIARKVRRRDQMVAVMEKGDITIVSNCPPQ